jgi:hypothetical protein
MTTQTLLDFLRQRKSEMQDAFGIKSLALFGSAARNELTEKSDIDVLVTFDGVANTKRYFGLLFFLEDNLKRPIDLVTEKGLRAEIRPFIEQDLIYV